MQQQFKVSLLLWTANSVVFSDRNCILEMNSEWVFGFLSESLGNDAKKETSLCNLSCPTENNAPTVSVWEEKIWPVSCSISPDLTRFYHPRRSFKYLERKLQETKSQTVGVWNLTWEVSPVLTLPVWSPDSMLETDSSCMIKENTWKRNEFFSETELLCVFVPLRTESGAGGHPVALPGGGRRVLRRRSALVPQSGPQQGPARDGHGDLQTSVPGEGRDTARKHKQWRGMRSLQSVRHQKLILGYCQNHECREVNNHRNYVKLYSL